MLIADSHCTAENNTHCEAIILQLEKSFHDKLKKKVDCFSQGHLPMGAAGFCQADRLTGADQVMPDGLV